MLYYPVMKTVGRDELFESGTITALSSAEINVEYKYI